MFIDIDEYMYVRHSPQFKQYGSIVSSDLSVVEIKKVSHAKSVFPGERLDHLDTLRSLPVSEWTLHGAIIIHTNSQSLL